jgi:YD repeat-containing protein
LRQKNPRSEFSRLTVQAWHWTYDDMGRQIAEIPPVNDTGVPLNASAWLYEPGGRLDATCSYPAGGSCSGTTNTHKTDLGYDKAGRPKTEATSANGTLAITVTTAYGLDGQPLTTGDGTDTLTSVYDPYGRLDQLKRSSAALTDYAYNADGTIASRVDGSLAATSFGYDWAKRPVSTTLSSTIYSGSPLSQTWRLDGLLDRVTLPTGPQSYTLGYDAARRPTSLTLQSGGSLSQAYDRAGNVVSEGRSFTGITGDAGTNTATYGYDRLSRLVSESGLATSRSYTYG